MRRRRLVLAVASLTLAAAVTLGACGASAKSSGSSPVSSASPRAHASGAPAAAPSPGSKPPGSSGSGGAPQKPPSGGSGGAPGGSSGAPGGTSTTAQYSPTGASTVTSGSASRSGTITATADDESGVLVKGGSLTLTKAAVTTSGASKSSDESSFYGLNAGVLVTSGKLTMTGDSVTTSGAGANGVFAYGSGSAISLSGTKISATGQYAHGIMASGGGTIRASGLTVSTAGGSSAPIATDRGGGTISVTGGTFRSSGGNSPGIYSTGKITATKASFVSTGSEAVVIEGANSATLKDCRLATTIAGKWGVMIYQSMSGDAAGVKGLYTQTGGSLTVSGKGSPLFYVTNSTGVIDLARVKLSEASGVLVKAAAGQWGTSGANGGTVALIASDQKLSGALVADKLSAISVTLEDGSVLTSTVNGAGTAKSISLTLGSSSVWKVSGDSHLTALTGARISGSTITNIVGNGHTVTYSKSASANSYLGGKTYKLAGGGTLKPR